MNAPTDLTDDVLADRIRAACAAQVADLDVRDAPFRPAAPTRFQGRHDIPGSAGRRPRLAAFAAVLLVAGALVATVLVVAQRDDPDTVVTGSTITTSPRDREAWALLPRSEPLGLPIDSVAIGLDESQAAGARTQLFASAEDGARVLVQVQPAMVYPQGDPVVVRGQSGRYRASTDPGRSEDTLSWEERGVDLEASVRGLGRDDAIAMLDGLRWRSEDPRDGFVPPSGGTMELVGDVGETAATRRVAVSYVDRYGDGQGANWSVVTWEAGVDGLRPQSLWVWFRADQRDARPDGEVRAFDPVVGVLEIAYPDGRVAQIEGPSSGTVAVATLEELEVIASDLHPVDDDSIEVLRDQAASRLQQLPIVATEEVSDDVVLELRGGAVDQAACIVVGGVRRCGVPEGAYRFVSTVIGDHWYIGAVLPTDAAVTRGSERTSRDLALVSGRMSAPFEDRSFVVAKVPDDLRRVTLHDGTAKLPLERPMG